MKYHVMELHIYPNSIVIGKLDIFGNLLLSLSNLWFLVLSMRGCYQKNIKFLFCSKSLISNANVKTFKPTPCVFVGQSFSLDHVTP